MIFTQYLTSPVLNQTRSIKPQTFSPLLIAEVLLGETLVFKLFYTEVGSTL